MSTGFPAWDAAATGDSVKRTYDWTVTKTLSQIRWYQEKKGPKSFGSRGIRAVSIFSGGLGALCPLLDSTDLFAGLSFAPYGYVLLAIPAGLITYDRLFGLSTGWIRYTVTQMALESALHEFQYDYQLLDMQSSGNTLALLQRIKEFGVLIENIVKKETDTWAAEFQGSIVEMERILKSEAQKRKPSSVKILLPNSGNFDKAEISLNGMQVKEVIGVTECILDSVPPGRYEISAKGIKDGTPQGRAAKVAEVAPEQMVSVELVLA